MTRFQKLAAATVVTTLLLVTIGVVVRATDSGLGCPDWPLCYGQLLPALDDPKAWIEWIHRTVAALIGFVILGLAVVAVVDHRDRRSILWPSLGAVVLVGFQAWLGRETVRLGNTGESVTAHLAAAMACSGCSSTSSSGRTTRPGSADGARASGSRCSRRSAPRRPSRCSCSARKVSAADLALVFPDWPLMGGTPFPPLTERHHRPRRSTAGSRSSSGVIVVAPRRRLADPA